MKDYKNNIEFLGGSDIATISFVTGKEHQSKSNRNISVRDWHTKVKYDIPMGSDGAYKVYSVDDESIIPSHYTEVIEITSETSIFVSDDYTLHDLNCKRVKVYRAGVFGIIVFKMK